MAAAVIPWDLFVQTWTDAKTGEQRSQLLTDNRKEIRVRTKGGFRVVPNSGWQKAMDAIRDHVRLQLRDTAPVALPIPVTMNVTLYPPSERMPDVLGLGKLLMDAMEGALYENDRQVRGALWRLPPVGGRVDAEDPRVVVRVEPWE